MSDDEQSTSQPGSVIDPVMSKKLLDALKDIANAQLSYERINHTLQPTALVNELWLRILRSESEPPTNINAFKAWASTAIRNILISHARERNALKRGGGNTPVLLQPNHLEKSKRCIDLLELEEELIMLEKHDSRAARVVELRFYGGMDHREVAEELGISVRLSQKSWAMARSWLSLRLRDS